MNVCMYVDYVCVCVYIIHKNNIFINIKNI